MPAYDVAPTTEARQLRLRTAELFVLSLARLWVIAGEGDAAEHALRSGFVDTGIGTAPAAAFDSMMLILSASARPLRIAAPKCRFVTDDEVRLLLAVGAAQSGDIGGMLSFLRAQLPPTSVRAMVRPTIRFGNGLARANVRLRPAHDILGGFGIRWPQCAPTVLAPRLALLN